jgi:hypothetical protein
MTAVPDTGLTRIVLDAGRTIRPRRSVLGVSVGVGTYCILDASLLGGPFGHDGALDRRLDGAQGALCAGGGS